MMPFNIVLKKLRQNKNMTQDELSKATGLSKSTISMYESGNRQPNFETLELFADFFNVDMNTLFDQAPSRPYYLNPETAKLAQEIYDNPQYKVLFDASKKLKPESIKEVMKFIDYQKSQEGEDE